MFLRLVPMLVFTLGLSSLAERCGGNTETVAVLKRENERAIETTENCAIELTRAQNIIRDCQCYCPENYFVPDSPAGKPVVAE